MADVVVGICTVSITHRDGIKNAAFKFNPKTPELVLAFPARREELSIQSSQTKEDKQ